MSDTSEVRITEMNLLGFVINILSIKDAVWSVIQNGMVIISMRDWDKREKKVQCVFVTIIVQNIKIEITPETLTIE